MSPRRLLTQADLRARATARQAGLPVPVPPPQEPQERRSSLRLPRGLRRRLRRYGAVTLALLRITWAVDQLLTAAAVAVMRWLAIQIAAAIIAALCRLLAELIALERGWRGWLRRQAPTAAHLRERVRQVIRGRAPHPVPLAIPVVHPPPPLKRETTVQLARELAALAAASQPTRRLLVREEEAIVASLQRRRLRDRLRARLLGLTHHLINWS